MEVLVGYLALPKAIAEWSRTNLRERLVKIGAKVVAPLCRRNWFEQILRLIGGLRPRPASRGLTGRMRHHHEECV